MTATLTEQLNSEWAAKTASAVLYQPGREPFAGNSEGSLTQSQREVHSLINFMLPLRAEDMSYLSTQIRFPAVTEAFVPRSPLGKKLLSLRIRAIEAGMKLLSADDVLEEVKRRRGELEEYETDVH